LSKLKTSTNYPIFNWLIKKAHKNKNFDLQKKLQTIAYYQDKELLRKIDDLKINNSIYRLFLNKPYFWKHMPHADQPYIDALIERDNTLIKEIYQKYAPHCKQFVLKNGGTEDDAKDIFQEAIISISLRAQSKYIELTVPFGAYLYRVYRNKWIDWLKKNRKNSVRIVKENGYIDIEDDNDQKELKYQIFKDCFEKLQPACKALFRMRFEGMKSKEIAAALKIKPNHADQKMYACREVLKNCQILMDNYLDLDDTTYQKEEAKLKPILDQLGEEYFQSKPKNSNRVRIISLVVTLSVAAALLVFFIAPWNKISSPQKVPASILADQNFKTYDTGTLMGPGESYQLESSPKIILAEGCEQYLNNQIEEAIQTFRKVINGNHSFAYENDANWYLALCYLKQDKPEKAKPVLRQLKQSDYGDRAKKILKQLE